MADVFISYSRHNIDFARNLFDTLEKGGRDSWIDWDNIPLTADWWKEIKDGIDGADAFVLIITPESVASPVCMLEVAHAIANNKRIIPIIHEEVIKSDALGRIAAVTPAGFLAQILGTGDLLNISRANWLILEKINWIFFREADNFDAGLIRLIAAVETDLERARLHTRLLVHAREWVEKHHDVSYLLVVHQEGS